MGYSLPRCSVMPGNPVNPRELRHELLSHGKTSDRASFRGPYFEADWLCVSCRQSPRAHSILQGSRALCGKAKRVQAKHQQSRHIRQAPAPCHLTRCGSLEAPTPTKPHTEWNRAQASSVPAPSCPTAELGPGERGKAARENRRAFHSSANRSLENPPRFAQGPGRRPEDQHLTVQERKPLMPRDLHPLSSW